MKLYTVAVLGATGAVGREMLKVLEERNFPVGKLIPLASARSAGKTMKFKGEDVVIREACDQAFEGVDIVLGAAENDIAKKFAPAIVRAGAVFVDNSSAFRMDPKVPLIVPEVNAEDVKNHNGIISNPNCSTIITITAVNALNAIAPIRSMTASTYQAVSGAGAGGPIELMGEVEALSKGESYEPKIFPYQIAYNLIPQIGGETFEGYTSEEMKMQNEGRKIMHLPELTVSCTCIRVPVIRSHSISVSLHFDVPVTVEQVDALREGRKPEVKVFQHQIAFNVIPQIGGDAFEGYTSEEMKLQNEGRKIMHLPELKVSCTCVRVPVVRSHSVSIVVRTKEKISVERARELIANAPGCRLVDELAAKRYPMPLDTSDQDIVFVGRIREDLTCDRGLNIWCCGDQVRKGAATNAVQIAELLVK